MWSERRGDEAKAGGGAARGIDRKQTNRPSGAPSHDLKIVEYLSDRVAVMYLGKIVEMAKSADIHRAPQHSYTRALLSAVPVPDPSRAQQRIILEGDVPNPMNPPTGCAFHPRCPLAIDRCRQEAPALEKAGTGASHLAACFRAGEPIPLKVSAA